MLTHLLLKATNVGAEWVLWILVILSLVSIAIIIERITFFRRHRIDGERLSTELLSRLQSGDIRGAHQMVADSDSIECIVVAAGLQHMSKGHTSCSEAMLSAKARERINVDTRISTLGTIGSNAPFIGLMGTVLGIIKAAHDMTGGGTGEANPSAVMAGVFEALVATAVGLLVAIPAVIAFNLFQRKVKEVMATVDSLAHMVLANAKHEKHSSSSGRSQSVTAPPAAAVTSS